MLSLGWLAVLFNKREYKARCCWWMHFCFSCFPFSYEVSAREVFLPSARSSFLPYCQEIYYRVFSSLCVCTWCVCLWCVNPQQGQRSQDTGILPFTWIHILGCLASQLPDTRLSFFPSHCMKTGFKGTRCCVWLSMCSEGLISGSGSCTTNTSPIESSSQVPSSSTWKSTYWMESSVPSLRFYSPVLC